MTLPTINNSTTNTSQSATLTLTVPTGLANGQLAMLLVVNDQTATNPQWNAPTDFTEIDQFVSNQGVSAVAYRRVVDGTEGGGGGWTGGTSTVNVVSQDTSAGACGYFLLWDDVDNTTPIDVVGTANDSQFSSQVLTLSGVTTSSNDCVAICLFGFDGSDTTTFDINEAGWTESAVLEVPGSGLGSTSIYGTEDLSGGGTSSDATVNFAPNDGRVGLIFAIRGSTGGGGATIPVFEHYYRLKK